MLYYLIRYLDARTDSVLWLIPTNLVNRDKLVKLTKLSTPNAEHNMDLAAFCYCLEYSPEFKETLEEWYFKYLDYDTQEYRDLREHWQTIVSHSKLVGDGVVRAFVEEVFDIQIYW